MHTRIPKGDYGAPGPCWIPVELDGRKQKPLIKCRCGEITGIGLHRVQANGQVTRSYFHSEADSFEEGGKTYAHRPGCGWHVWLLLDNYCDGDFPPLP
jgi:hypothetical protein